MRLLLDEMYPPVLARALGEVGIDAVAVADLRLSGAPDSEIFVAALAAGRAILTENVADFTRLVAEFTTSGGHHNGLVVALSSRFSRRPAGLKPLVAALRAVAEENLDDRVVYLQPLSGRR